NPSPSSQGLNMYTWQEIQRHNQETDQWLVINRKVYDVTGWADRHPGGHQVLNHYAGEDATDVFRAIHPDPDIVRLYLKPLLIGELAPEEPNQERNKNVSEVSGLKSMQRDEDELYFRVSLSFSVVNQPSCLGGPAIA
uniref:Cytochrome b5 heme-binding domain-containing protein n=1 Tax=Moschus moschiferus TaxID=68415 RepID=A0A8C6FVS9_MOSMO